MRYKTLTKIRTRRGLHRPGEEGEGYDQADGTVNFFPDRGGFARLPNKSLAKLGEAKAVREGRPLAPFERVRKIKRVRHIKRIRHIKRVR